MQELKILNKIWLTELESKIYLDLLHNWSSNIVEISNRIGINRPAIYKTLPHLQEISLINKTVKSKRILYKAESPIFLKDIFGKLTEDFNKVLPNFENYFNKQNYSFETQIYEGIKWIKNVYLDIVNSLKPNSTFYRYSSRKNLESWLDLKEYEKIRDEKNIKRLVITSNRKVESKKPKNARQMVSVPENFDLFDDNVSKLIYWDKIAIVDYENKVAYVIQNPLLAKFEEKIFKLLFNFLDSKIVDYYL